MEILEVYLGSGQTESIDCAVLLEKYMQWIVHEESISFVDDFRHGSPCDCFHCGEITSFFSAGELVYLRALSTKVSSRHG